MTISLFQRYFDFCDWWHDERRIARTTAVQWSAIVVAIILVFVIEWGNAKAFARELEQREAEITLSGSGWELVERSVSLFSTSGHTAEGDTHVEDIPVEQMNVTKAVFELTWSDDIGSNDRFSVHVTAPDGQTGAGESDGGSIIIEMALCDVSMVDGPGENGTGEWRVEITAEQCPGVFPRLPDRDSGNDWSLDMDCSYYERKEG